MLITRFTKTKTSILLSSLILLGIVIVPQVRADEILITGNGSNSNNEASVVSAPQTTVQQSNNADITNSVPVTANTGDNKASDNTGGSVGVSTGDASSNVSVSNAANSSTVKSECCNQQSTNVVISGNGSGSHNDANVTNNSSTNVVVDQNANIVNDLSQYLNTGRNRANDNTGGDVEIRTGDILSKVRLKNGPINISDILVPAGDGAGILIKIAGNGSHSRNDVNVFVDNETGLFVHNVADIVNNIRNRFNTGENSANGNTGGNVTILTGAILSSIDIENGPINVSKAVIVCCEKAEEQKEQEKPQAPSQQPSAPSAVESSSPSQAPSPAQVLGAAAANLLPVTGNNWLFFAMLANVVMMLLGAYLRLRSGRSPGMAL